MLRLKCVIECNVLKGLYISLSFKCLFNIFKMKWNEYNWYVNIYYYFCIFLLSVMWKFVKY